MKQHLEPHRPPSIPFSEQGVTSGLYDGSGVGGRGKGELSPGGDAKPERNAVE